MTRAYSLNELFDLFSKDFDQAFSTLQSSNVFQGSFPPYDVQMDEKSKDLFFSFALAGYKEEDINLEFHNDYLHLNVSPISDEDKNSQKRVLYHGIKKGSANLTLGVPANKYQHDKAEASFEDGMLHVFVPRKEEEKPKKITLKKQGEKLLT